MAAATGALLDSLWVTYLEACFGLVVAGLAEAGSEKFRGQRPRLQQIGSVECPEACSGASLLSRAQKRRGVSRAGKREAFVCDDYFLVGSSNFTLGVGPSSVSAAAGAMGLVAGATGDVS